MSAFIKSTVFTALFLCELSGQVSGQPTEEERAAEMKRRVLEVLNLHPGDSVADVGCGDGFYTIPLARLLGPSGRVYAEDISDTKLVHLKQHLAAERLGNVKVILGVEDDPKLPAHQFDAVLVANAYHEMAAHEAMLHHIQDALKEQGMFVLMEGIWDNRESQSRDEQAKHHQLAPQIAKVEVENAGFEIVEIRDPFIARPPDEDGKSRWWLIVARKPRL